MAEAAEVLQFDQLPIAEVVELQPRFFDADMTDQLCFARRRFRQMGEEIMAQNHELLMQGEWDSVPVPIDAQGTAFKVLAAERQYGTDSHEYRQNWQGLLQDCERVYGEAYSKNGPEYFPRVCQERDPHTGMYYSHGQPLSGIVAGGLSPVAKSGEQPLRIDDFVEEMTYEIIGNMELEQETVSVLTVLECPDWVIEEYEANPEGAFYGYVPSIRKLMLRGISFYNKGNVRYEEQLALPGIEITHEVVLAVLKETERIETGMTLTKTELHSKQFVDTEGGDVFEFAKKLDTKASELSGKNIFMGEEVEEGHPKDYEVFKREAEERHQSKERQREASELRTYILELAKDKTDRWAADSLVANFVDKSLKRKARNNPELAEMVYDKKTADGYREVAALRAAGRHSEADHRQEQVEQDAPVISYCGAGSCGLKKVISVSKKAEKGRQQGLVGEMLEDTERSCPKCGQLTVIYDEHGSKACINEDCENTEIKG